MVAIGLWLVVAPLQVWAGGGDIESRHVAASAAYWTAERLRNAVPMPLPRPTKTLPRTAEESLPKGSPVGEEGQGPTVRVLPGETNRLFEPETQAPDAIADEDDALEAEEPEQRETRSVGSEGAYFTSSRLVPLSADRVYPYRTVGKLFFTAPGSGDMVCSASVIKRRLIVTAGHCVHKGSGGTNGFYTNFLFVPAFRNGDAPYGSWNGVFVFTTTWMNGGGTFPNAADYALIEMQDNTSGKRIGDVTGFLGYRTYRLIPNHAHLLGYPLNLDNGMIMHQVTAGSFKPASPNAAEYGSDMTNGSSGGPWIQNFGVQAKGQNGSQNDSPNQVIGVTSYGKIDPERKIQGSSIFDRRFVDLIKAACAHRQGNC